MEKFVCGIWNKNEVTIPLVSCSNSEESFYSLAVNKMGVIAAGSSDKMIHLFDINGNVISKLKGHIDNIKAVYFSNDGNYLVSGSSDCSIKLWDLRQKKCIKNFYCHKDSIWTLWVDDSFENIYSGGKDKTVYKTNISNEESTIICEESAPILKIIPNNNVGLFISTTKPQFSYWSLVNVSSNKPIFTSPSKKE